MCQVRFKKLNPVRDYRGKEKAQREQISNGVKIPLVTIVIISLIGAYLPLDFLLPPKVAEASPASWMTGWSYRRAITIDNTGNVSTLTDYQVSVDTTKAIYDETGLVGSWYMNENFGHEGQIHCLTYCLTRLSNNLITYGEEISTDSR